MSQQISPRGLGEMCKLKTEICKNWLKGYCPFEGCCNYSHGEVELNTKLNLHPKYKSKLCTTYNTTGSCPYGNRCQFLHSEIHSYWDQLDGVIKLNEERKMQKLDDLYCNLGKFKRLQLFQSIIRQ